MIDDAKLAGPQAQCKAYLAQGRFMIQRSLASQATAILGTQAAL